MRMVFLLKTLLLTMLATLMVACSGGVNDASNATKENEKLTVLTTFTVIADMAQNVAGDAAVVQSLIKAGAEVHDYEPTPQDLAKVKHANLILWNGLDLERWFERFYQDAKDVPSALVSEGIEAIVMEGDEINPHAWMSSSNALIYVENIKKALIEADPANQAVYEANAAAYMAKIQSLDEQFREQLRAIPAERRWLASSEGAFSYLTQDYGLNEVYLWAVNADHQGTPQQVKAMIDAVRQHNIPAVFSESTVSDKPARQVAQESGAKYGGVLYVDSLSEPDGKVPTYLDLLEVTVSTIIEGLKTE